MPLDVPLRVIAQYECFSLCRSDSSESCFTSLLFLYLYALPVSVGDSQRTRAAANKKQEKKTQKAKQKFSRDAVGLEEDIFSVSFLLLEMVMQQLLEFNKAGLQ